MYVLIAFALNEYCWIGMKEVDDDDDDAEDEEDEEERHVQS
jgi:hypothetical protein